MQLCPLLTNNMHVCMSATLAFALRHTEHFASNHAAAIQGRACYMRPWVVLEATISAEDRHVRPPPTWTPKIANIMKNSSTTMLTLPMAAKLSVRDLKMSCMPAERVSALSGLMARSTRRACSQ
eukprot:GHUV01022836.1.p1 GENE.GHUV01022836.1~~GHUV01022836.1.p1  ORF type:complete len:124 (+),score=24.57 GHUV01022836.1:415-786(+)